MTTKTVDPAIFKAYDVRAVYPTQIDGEVARRVGRAFVDFLGGAPRIAVVDYGVNNLKSVVRALAAGGHTATLTTDPAAVSAADHVLVPGVGHFNQAMKNLGVSGLGAAIQDAARAGRPVMGICLGLQLFFARSEEAPEVAGLGLLPGNIQRFTTALHVPHVGWASVQPTPPTCSSSFRPCGLPASWSRSTNSHSGCSPSRPITRML